MSDRLRLEFCSDGKTWNQVTHFLSYSLEADLYLADHAFSIELANPEVEILKGSQCRLYVNDQLELTGVVDRRLRRCDKKGRKQVIEGRDLMGILVDAFVEEFVTVQGKTLGQLAEFLIGPNRATGRPALPFINRKLITGQTGLAGKLDTRRRRGTAAFAAFFDTPQPLRQMAPGMTVFQVLQTYALSSGVMFYSLPDGRFVFDRPVTGGEADYNIAFGRAGVPTNALAGEVDENISKAYSKVTVIGQQQGQDIDAMDATKIQVKASVTDASFPFYKSFVQCTTHDSQSPQQHARLILERMRHESQRLCYEMPRHSQDGKNFAVNRLALLDDRVHGVSGTYLVTGRTFKLSKDDGPTTSLKLSLPGIVEDRPMRGHGR